MLLTLDIEGTEALAIPKAIQRHALRGTFDHVDLLAVRRGEKITVDVAVVLEGEIAPLGLLQQEHTSLSVETEATHIPTEIVVSIEGLEIGAQITAADITLPAGTTLVGDPEQIILLVSEAPTAEQLDAEMDEAAAELGIEQDEPQGETDAGAGPPASGGSAEGTAGEAPAASAE